MKTAKLFTYDIWLVVKIDQPNLFNKEATTDVHYTNINADNITLAIKYAIEKYEKDTKNKVKKLVAIPKLVRKVEVVYSSREINKWLNKR